MFIILLLTLTAPLCGLTWLRVTGGWDLSLPAKAGKLLESGPAATVACNTGLSWWPLQLGFVSGWSTHRGNDGVRLHTIPLLLELTWHPFKNSGTVPESRGLGFFAGSGTALEFGTWEDKVQTGAGWLLSGGLRFTVKTGYRTGMVFELRCSHIRERITSFSTISLQWGWKFALNKEDWL